MNFNVEMPAEGEAIVSIGAVSTPVNADHFAEPATDSARRILFKQTVQNVVVETSSYCNRRCGFCPNVDGTRLGGERLLPVDLFERIVADLGAIDYQRNILLHLYNEPMAAMDSLLERVSMARRAAPASKIKFNTNGDYLTRERLAELAHAGLTGIFVSVYGRHQGQWDDRFLEKRVRGFVQRLGMDGPISSAPGLSHAASGKVQGVEVSISARNLWRTGYDRGGLIEPLSVHRESPCLSPFTEFIVDHKGYVLPCCNVYTDRPEHIEHTIGNIRDFQSIFHAYSHPRLASWRKGLLAFSPGGELCRGCSRMNQEGHDSASNRSLLARAIAHIQREPTQTQDR